ncbi:uncharacterized protein BO66DRAFT_436305 [Aspergillus aculeatinus CBS 121060]|uniref:Uncharacterized protein n=1 Tax=Aspergillus aculeatinus CBS 121060 TaxID=1448322 RepID=A0ACD1HGD7_9EURO|nr:hypothetical protein BO66DRAFT_436305 [Aspergillus aculeatinus CBS 121060]RAH72640.1 hypothetical protein BO66DRAFT_436305 [Aspergillus aculeatinus CBS 121060]
MLFVQAWPSTGRFWRKENPTPAELRYMRFGPSSSKLQVPRSPPQTEEDAFTKQLRRIDALEWENKDRCEEAYFGDSLDIGLRRFRQATYGSWSSVNC